MVPKRAIRVLSAALLMLALVAPSAGASADATSSSSCGASERAAQLADAQRQILAMLRQGTPLDLTVLKNAADLAALAALGYGFYDHQQTSVRGMGWAVVDLSLAAAGGPTSPGHPSLLLYAPSGEDVISPRDGFDFPYYFVGWAYAFNYIPREPPKLLTCLGIEEWFVHEAGVHTFADGDFVPVRPDNDEPRGKAMDELGPCPEFFCTSREPGDFGHGRLWDIHMWVGPWVPTVSMTNPGHKIPGINPRIGKAFFYPEYT